MNDTTQNTAPPVTPDSSVSARDAALKLTRRNAYRVGLGILFRAARERGLTLSAIQETLSKAGEMSFESFVNTIATHLEGATRFAKYGQVDDSEICYCGQLIPRHDDSHEPRPFKEVLDAPQPSEEKP